MNILIRCSRDVVVPPLPPDYFETQVSNYCPLLPAHYDVTEKGDSSIIRTPTHLCALDWYNGVRIREGVLYIEYSVFLL